MPPPVAVTTASPAMPTMSMRFWIASSAPEIANASTPMALKLCQAMSTQPVSSSILSSLCAPATVRRLQARPGR